MQTRVWQISRSPLVLGTVIAAVVFVVLVGANLNGTSIGWLSDSKTDPHLLLGEPRAWRSDEWAINTPTSVGNDRVGLPASRQIGLTDTEVAVAVLAGPSSSWAMAFRPQDWGYAVLDASHGLAWHWWFSFLLCFVGLLAWFRSLRVPTLAMVTLSVLGTFSPYTGVWSSPATPLFLGFGGLAAALMVGAMRAGRRWHAIVLAAGAGWSVVALVVPLYPPWTIPVGLIAGAVVVGQTIDGRFQVRRWLTVYGVVVAVAAVGLAVFFLQNKAGIAASMDTIYPGQRRVTAGAADPAAVLSAPLNPWIVNSSVLVPEVSATWLPVGVLVVVVALVLTTLGPPLRRDGSEGTDGRADTAEAPAQDPQPATVVALTMVTALLVCWAFVHVPAIIGKATLLDRVAPGRLQLGLGLCALLWVGLLARRAHTLTIPMASLWIVGVVVTVLATFWSRSHLLGLAPSSLILVTVSAGVLAAGVAGLAYARWRVVAASVLVCFAVGQWALVNPLYQGLGALQDEPIVASLLARQSDGHPLRVIALEPVPPTRASQLTALATSAGADVLSGVQHYPDAALMSSLFPGQKRLWNNYARFEWAPDPKADRAVLERLAPDALRMWINPCGQTARALQPDLVISSVPLPGYRCLIPDGTVPWRAHSSTIYLYRL